MIISCGRINEYLAACMPVKFAHTSFLSRFNSENSETLTANHNVHPLI